METSFPICLAAHDLCVLYLAFLSIRFVYFSLKYFFVFPPVFFIFRTSFTFHILYLLLIIFSFKFSFGLFPISYFFFSYPTILLITFSIPFVFVFPFFHFPLSLVIPSCHAFSFHILSFHPIFLSLPISFWLASVLHFSLYSHCILAILKTTFIYYRNG